MHTITDPNKAEVDKKAAELRAFKLLAPLIIDVILDSIQQPREPEPDILCECSRAGALAFELVALDAKADRQQHSVWDNTKDYWAQALAQRSPEQQNELRRRFADMHIVLSFNDTVSERDRSKDLTALQSLILSGRRDLNGDVINELIQIQAREGKPIRSLTSAGLYHGAADGPHITSMIGTSWSFPQTDLIKRKLSSKSYKPDRPLELMAYGIYSDPDGHVNSLNQIKEVVNSCFPNPLFSRVAIFDVGSRRLLWRSE
jgi:hypothetical protein